MKADGRPLPAAEQALPKTTLERLKIQYFETHEKSLEPNTAGGIKIHFAHLLRFFGKDLLITDITLAELQRYVDKRSRDPGQMGNKLSAATIQKEIISSRTAFNWAIRMKLVTGPFPNKGLRYPKSSEKPPFMTKTEIETKLQYGGLTPAEIDELYDGMYLTTDELVELLEDVKAKGSQALSIQWCASQHIPARGDPRFCEPKSQMSISSR